MPAVAPAPRHAVVKAPRRSTPRHPPGLTVLYLTEVWERFSFYGLKALLVLYLNSGVLAPERFANVWGSAVVALLFGQASPSTQSVQALSSRINQCYSGAAYITPLGGGVVADRLLGTRPTLVVGGVLMALGHGCMAFEPTVLVGLLLLVLGNGCFKPTVSALLSRLYEPPAMGSLRDRGFAIFYTGINVGALLAPLVCGALQQSIGFDAGFGAAGIGMVIGLLCFFAGARHLPGDAIKRPPQPASTAAAGEPLLAATLDEDAPDADPCRPADRQWRLESALGLVGICGSIIPFWVAFEQWSNTVPLFFRDLTDRRTLGGAEVPAAWLQSLSPLFCIGLMPLLTGLWADQGRRGVEPQPCTKMACGCALQGGAWLLMAAGSVGVSEAALAPLVLPLSATVLLTAGQLFLAPVGLSLVSRCCPPQMKSTAIGVWFLAGGLGGLIAGPVGTLYGTWSRPAFFSLLSLVCFADAALVGLCAPQLHRLAASFEDGESKRKRDDANGSHEVEEEEEAGVVAGATDASGRRAALPCA